MNLTKKQMMVAAIVIGAVAVWYFFIRKKKIESGYDENLMIFGNENGYGPDYGAYGNYGYETGFAWNKAKDWRKTIANPGTYGGEFGYSTSAVTYGGTKAATAVSTTTPVRPIAPTQPVGSNEGQKCNKDHQCSPGLYCVNGRCGKRGKMPVSTGWIKGSPYTGESGYERKKGPLDTSPTFPDENPTERINCPANYTWNGYTCVKKTITSPAAGRTMISCPEGQIFSGGKCVPIGVGGSESNWFIPKWMMGSTKGWDEPITNLWG